jgi:hypothetical protein
MNVYHDPFHSQKMSLEKVRNPMNPPMTSHIRFETPGTSALRRVMRAERTVRRGLGGEQGYAPFFKMGPSALALTIRLSVLVWQPGNQQVIVIQLDLAEHGRSGSKSADHN